jgi:hypothetical protein
MSEGFLGRWSRRKREAAQEEDRAPGLPQRTSRQDKAQVAPDQRTASLPDDGSPTGAVQAPGDEPAPSAPLPTLEDAQQLTPDSDFQPFMQRGVGAEVRNAAMKKLFADPHFNVMDGLDIYIDDYSQPDPMPAGMLRKMASAQFMKLVPEEGADSRPQDPDASAAPVQGPEVVAQSPVSSPTAQPPSHDHPDLQLQPDAAASGAQVEPGPR